MYSAKKIYHQPLCGGSTEWPVKIVVPEIERCLETGGLKAAEDMLLQRLAEDYDEKTPKQVVAGRPWFGRCVYEAGNDVCDDQFVTITWDDDNEATAAGQESGVHGRRPHRNTKRASFHMVAFTEKICQRRSRFYGTKGELEADDQTIRVFDFATGNARLFHPPVPGGGHGGGDDGLVRQFLLAINAVKHQGSSVRDAQREYMGCTLDEVLRSHAMVFAAEDARRTRQVVDWSRWWHAEVETKINTNP